MLSKQQSRNDDDDDSGDDDSGGDDNDDDYNDGDDDDDDDGDDDDDDDNDDDDHKGFELHLLLVRIRRLRYSRSSLCDDTLHFEECNCSFYRTLLSFHSVESRSPKESLCNHWEL